MSGIRNVGRRRRVDAHAALTALICLTGAQVAMADGVPLLDLRLRHEAVDEQGFDRNAQATTLRARFGWRQDLGAHWSVLAEGDYITHLFAEHFNSTTNGRTRYPVVADPDETELNRAFLAYDDGSLHAAVGRQRLQYDNLRFIANVGWRQNEQTYDAFDLEWKPGNGVPALRYSYLDRAHRVFGDHHPQGEFDLDGHLFHIQEKLPLGELAAYAYLVDNRSVAALSSVTYGARWQGATEAIGFASSFGWLLEAARQRDYADNPANYELGYWRVEPSLRWGSISTVVGYERLGGNGTVALQTPLATLHAFNGWADRFLSTPVDGLEDVWLGLKGKHGRFDWQALWHDYSAARGGRDYGSEWDLALGYAVGHGVSALVKYADYDSDGFSVDVRKLWFNVEYKY